MELINTLKNAKYILMNHSVLILLYIKHLHK